MNDVVILSDGRMAQALVAAQLPQWAGLSLEPVAAQGTDTVIFRIGTEMALRMPRRPEAATLLGNEITCLSRLKGLPLRVPGVRFAGAASAQFPWPFAVVDWIAGETAQDDAIRDWPREVEALAGFLRGLWKQSVKGAPLAGPTNHMRGAALSALTPRVLEDLGELSDELDEDRAREVWLDALEAPAPRKPVWVHGDLKADNMIARSGRLVGVIDWGLAAVGDPAVDVAVAWRWVPELEMMRFRDALGARDALWRRARGWALYMAVVALAHYRERDDHVALVEDCRCVIGRLGLTRSC